MYRRILVPLDGSALAAGVLEHLLALARRYRAQLILLTVGPPAAGESRAARGTHWPSTFEAEAYLLRLRDWVRAQGLEARVVVRIGDPAAEILACAEREGADLIVMASRGGGGTPSPFLGSVAARVLRAATVPVLVLRVAAAPPPSRGEGPAVTFPALAPS
ncbi:MAG: hypothetical protein KatS3mg131_1419 [Candidatus Tectimicrobiota bacterium]|nr:MAG: hypothetical protein KatS3mg131_1419 [Candidatus Tectomicrobia bacterium]